MAIQREGISPIHLSTRLLKGARLSRTARMAIQQEGISPIHLSTRLLKDARLSRTVRMAIQQEGISPIHPSTPHSFPSVYGRWTGLPI
jgi:hypothetical protein